MQKKILLGFAIVLLIGNVSTFPTGAPKSACLNMTPRHRDNVPQTSPAPIRIVLSASRVAPGGSVTVRLESVDQDYKFKGFMVQPRNADDPDSIVGTLTASDDNAKIVDCDGPTTLTHFNFAPKSAVEFKWTAPEDFKGRVVIKTTIVESFSVFWTEIMSEPIGVTN